VLNKGIMLGHSISTSIIQVDKAKVEVITTLSYPKIVKEVRSLLGHIGYYRRFIRDFSKAPLPLSNLLKKDVGFEIDDSCKEAFLELRKILRELEHSI